MDSKIDEKIITKVEKNVLLIKLNNPTKKNSITGEMLKKIVEILENGRKDENVRVIYFTSTGEFFSSGNDFNNFAGQTLDEAIAGFENFIKYLITYPKVLIAGVNGAAIGMTFTMLALFDMVVASDTAFFTVPFMQTYQTPEGCSSLLFPLLLGKSNASNLLINGGVLNAEDAKKVGFITNIYEKEFFEKDAYDYALKVAQHPLKNLMKIKSIINKNFTKLLLEVNASECKDLRESWNQKEFQGIIKKFVKNAKF